MATDAETLLYRPRITQPHEEFLLLPPPGAAAPPEPSPTPFVPASPSLELRAEAARLQELYDLIVAGVPDLTVPVAGQQVRPAEYLQARADRTRKGRQLRQGFERQLLHGCGSGLYGNAWPLLLAPRLLDFQDLLLTSVLALEGTLGQGAVQAAAASGSPLLRQVTGTIQQQAVAYRSLVGRALWSFEADLAEGLFRCLFSPALAGVQSEVRPTLERLRTLVRTLKGLLCHAQLLQLLKFRKLRESLGALVETLLLQQIVFLLTNVLARAQQTLIAPFLGLMADSRSPLHCVGDAVSSALFGAAAEAAGGLHGQLIQLLTDVVRESEQRTQEQLAEVRALAANRTVGRWLLRLTEIERLLDRALTISSSQELARQVTHTLMAPLVREGEQLLSQLERHPDYRDLRQRPLLPLSSLVPETGGLA